MARSRKKSRSVSAAPAVSRTMDMRADGTPLKQEHKTFSHIMYFLFLICVTIATFFTFQSFGVLTHTENAEYFYMIFAILMLCWSFLFWEFGHRIHQ